MDKQTSADYLQDEGKTTEQLINELRDLRQQVVTLKRSASQWKRMETRLKLALERYQNRGTEISALFQCANLILLKRDFIDTARTIFESCKNVTGATAGYVALLSDDKRENRVLFIDSGGLPCALNPDIPMPVQGLHAEAYSRCTALYQNELSGSECINILEGRISLKNLLLAPLVIDGKALGLIGLANKPEDFSDNDAQITEAFAELAAIALYNTRTLEALKESEAKFRSLIQIAPVLIVHLTPDHNIIEFNNAAEKFYGSKREDILGKDYLELFLPKERRDDFLEAVKKVLAGEPTRGLENYFSTPDGEKRLLSWDMDRRLDANNKPIGVIAVGQDITGRREAEEELLLAQSKIIHQEKMASIGQLAAGVAHEINNPMGFITSNLRTLDKYAEKFTEFIQVQARVITSLCSSHEAEALNERRKRLKLDYITEDIKELISESLEGANRVKTIVQNLKSFSRVDEAAYKPADINQCIESTLNIVWNELKYKTTVRTEYGDIPLTKCYPQQLNQVFMNVFVNAAHAIEKRGEIGVKTWDNDGSIYISISDTGQGIPDEKISRIFEPFFTTKELGKGTGLGLSICYEIVEKHNGEITVKSEVGKGTSFTIKIPVVEE